MSNSGKHLRCLVRSRRLVPPKTHIYSTNPDQSPLNNVRLLMVSFLRARSLFYIFLNIRTDNEKPKIRCSSRWRINVVHGDCVCVNIFDNKCIIRIILVEHRGMRLCCGVRSCSVYLLGFKPAFVYINSITIQFKYYYIQTKLRILWYIVIYIISVHTSFHGDHRTILINLLLNGLRLLLTVETKQQRPFLIIANSS